MSSNTNSSSISKCAACGKGGDNLKVCTSCEQVSYCNAKCRNSHRSKHKKECKQYAAKIREKNAALRAEADAIDTKIGKIIDSISDNLGKMSTISDEELFADPPPKEDCAICFLPMPFTTGMFGVDTSYQTCCGKIVCSGCMEVACTQKDSPCPFCRMPTPSIEVEHLGRCKKRMAAGDAEAFYNLAGVYERGVWGLPVDRSKELDLLKQAAELGSCAAHSSLAYAYRTGDGAEIDMEKAVHHWKRAAILGDESSRYCLGVHEEKMGNLRNREFGMIPINDANYNRAMKHFMISARAGCEKSLKAIGEGYKSGIVTKEEYGKALRAQKESQEGMKSEQRENARKKREREGKRIIS